MQKLTLITLLGIGLWFGCHTKADGQITKLQDYQNNYSAKIGTHQNINFREGGFSGMYPVAGTNGKEFWVISDRGVNIDAANANSSSCRPTYDKIFVFPNYAPKIHRVRLNGDSVQILQTITMKRPNGTGASGVLNPTGFGSTATEVGSTDTVLNCSRFNLKTTAKDVWGIDAEGIVVDKDGNFWISEENGPTIWKLNANGVVTKRYTPYANLAGAQSIDVQIDTVFKYRKNNRGFEGLSIAPNGKLYAIIQSPILYPNKSIGEGTQVHRILEIDPSTNAMRMFAYLNDGLIGAGADQIRLRDWKIGDMAAINDSTFLVLEAGLRGATDVRRVYKVSLKNASVVNSGLYGGKTLEALVNLAGLTAQGITPVKKTLLMDLNANGWPTALEKAEGLAIINDSTIFICNDNDYGQVSPLENGIATATGITSHVIKFGLSGTGKLQNFNQLQLAYNQGITGPSTKQTPYLQPLQEGVQFTSILGAGEKVGNYTMAGLPDGTGAFDNGDGTFTFLVNHEIGNTSGSVRAHGSKGAFVSKWIINKSDLSVVSGSDLIQNINLWNPATSSYITYNAANPSIGAALTRLCSADLPSVSAFYNSKTGKGTTERIFMDGEESGTEGRAFGHIVTGLNGGTSYELPYLGKFSWENSVANPYESDKTVVAGTDDAGGGQIYIYIGEKSTTGNEIEKAGLSGGKLYGLKVTGYSTETSATIPTAGSAFTLADLGNVQNMTGTAINTASVSAGVTGFLRPEDGSWDPSNPSDFYFLTTNAFNSPSRLWKAHFSDVTDLTKGGTITAVLDGTEGQQMLDNMTVDHYGHIIMQEDVGNNVHNGKFWQYTIATDELKVIAQHDPTRFISGGANFLTQDEEGSGVIDAQSILGPGMFLAVDQAHYSISGEVVEGGQLMAFFNPDTYNANPEIALIGNNNNIVNGDITPDAADNTNFGKANPGNTISKTFEIKNDGPGALTVSGISIGGTNAAQFSLVSAPVFPLTLAANSTQNITVKFAPLAAGNYNATVNILSNDFDEAYFNFAISGSSTCSTYVSQIAVSPEYTVSGQQAKTIYLGYGTQSVDLTVSVSNASGNYSYSWSPVSSTDNKITVSPTSTTTYTATITDQYGCTSTENVTVNVIDVRDGNKAKAIICHKGKTLSVGTANVADHLSHGDKLGTCGAGKNTGEEVALSVENENAADFSVNVYPNPSNKQALVSVQLPQAAAMVLSVTDIQGKTVLPASKQYFSAGENQVILNTSTLENGIYFVRLVGANEVKEVKLVIVH